MLRSFLTRLGLGSEPKRAAPVPRRPAPMAHAEPEQVRPTENGLPKFPPEAGDFLRALIRTPASSDLQALPPDDRIFLSEIMKRLRENTLEIPVLPHTAIEVSRLLADPRSSLADFVKAIESDPALSVGLLRIANSAFYGFSGQTNSLRDAVFRIGLSQLRTIVILSHLQGKVLQTGLFEREVSWLSDLSLAMARLGQLLAPELGLEPSVAFTHGTLWHLEHFLILGTLAEVARQHRVKTHPSEACLNEAFFRFGPKIRELASRLWELEEVLGRNPKESEVAARYEQLQGALISEGSGEDLPQEIDWVSPQKLRDALKNLS